MIAHGFTLGVKAGKAARTGWNAVPELFFRLREVARGEDNDPERGFPVGMIVC